MSFSTIYNENFIIKKFGHIKNIALKDISTHDLEKLIIKLSHDFQLVKAMQNVITSRNTINISEELEKIENENNQGSEKKVRELTVIPDNYKLTVKMMKYANQNNITSDNAEKLFKNFQDYYILKQFKSRDWNKLWNDWVDKNIGYIYTEKEPSQKPNPFEFTSPIKNEKYPRIFINNKDFFIVNTISEQIIELLYEAGFKYESFDKINGISNQKCRSPINGKMQTIFYFNEGVTADYFKKSLSSEIYTTTTCEVLTKIEYDNLVRFSNHARKHLESVFINWKEDYFLKHKKINTKQGYTIDFKSVINPYTKNEEILLIKS